MPINYDLGKIYKIICNETGLIYIGSTCQSTLARRLSSHVQKFKYWNDGKHHFVTSFKIIEAENYYDIVLIENFPCKTKDELHSRERYYIELLECVNKVIPSRTKKEYRNIHKDYFKEYQKQYNIDNYDKLKQKRIEYNEQHKEDIKHKQKIHYNQNKEKIQNKIHEYYEKNKEHIKQNHKQKCICECGSEINKFELSRHKKSKKHLALLAEKNNKYIIQIYV